MEGTVFESRFHLKHLTAIELSFNQLSFAFIMPLCSSNIVWVPFKKQVIWETKKSSSEQN